MFDLKEWSLGDLVWPPGEQTTLTQNVFASATCLRFAAAATVLFLFVIAGASCTRSRAPRNLGFDRRMAVPVLVSAAVKKSVPTELKAIGTAEAFSTVTVKSQVNGELVGVHFERGQEVRKGQLLFTIDPRPFEAALAQAQAELERDRALAKKARQDEYRNGLLLQNNAISQQEYDQAKATADGLSATVLADEAAVQTAKLNLAYCSIRSPIDGRTGDLLIHKGNIVKANDSSGELVTIKQLRPIFVDFYLPERELEEVKKSEHADPPAVEAVISGDSDRPEHGRLAFIDNAVDGATGTFQLKGIFENAQERLWPGQFADVTLIIGEQPNSILVPSQAVVPGQNGPFVYVVERNMVVSPRQVTVGETLEGETIIKRGLRAGETVVTDGQLRLFPGAKVRIKQSLGASPPRSS